jgi:hypothetical protein
MLMLSICEKLDCPCPYCPPKQKLLDRLEEFSKHNESQHIRLNPAETKYLYELVEDDLKDLKRTSQNITITDFNDRMNKKSDSVKLPEGYGQTFHLDSTPKDEKAFLLRKDRPTRVQLPHTVYDATPSTINC